MMVRRGSQGLAAGVNFRRCGVGGGGGGDAGLLTRAVWSAPPAHGWEWLQGPEDLAFPACPSSTLLKGVKSGSISPEPLHQGPAAVPRQAGLLRTGSGVHVTHHRRASYTEGLGLYPTGFGARSVTESNF